MDNKEQLHDESDHDAQRPPKRARRTPPPPATQPPTTGSPYNPTSNGNGKGYTPHASALPPLSVSILGVEPMDEFIREVADFVHHMISTRPEGPGQVEVEAKIGVLRDKMSGQRIQLPVLVETILVPNAIDCRFESNMSPMQHRHFNGLLNGLKVSPPPYSTSPISYEHLRLIDSFYASEGHGERIRVTRDEKSGTVQACVRKVRLASLDIYCPKRAADWRISVNVEVPVQQPIGTATHTRRKDRMSYSHEEFLIDLTQVTSNAAGKTEVLHELEVEIARSDFLLSMAAKRGDPSVPEQERGAFDELIRAFVNNARILVRNAGDGWQ
ncbi:mRNA capping enzyme [Laetiporus sulphureus 93-53]|uniref:mRNA-capping enzyme subunit beta n=1 Tax=Laetiporus sulphureus 93-53 TaxID=1314785 RepID=A0A165FPV0_9APHY|nr:mRNA capping enzyme [Laetiporus sulphureus 93-53]KZT09295.1 mRNA capping enzyme [Laetiporus sulphureus 93-53]